MLIVPMNVQSGRSRGQHSQLAKYTYIRLSLRASTVAASLKTRDFLGRNSTELSNERLESIRAFEDGLADSPRARLMVCS
jgi:hypothetical protein